MFWKGCTNFGGVGVKLTLIGFYALCKKKKKKSQKNKTKQKAFIVARQRLKFETSLLKIEDLLHYEFKCQKFCKIIFWGVCFLDLNY